MATPARPIVAYYPSWSSPWAGDPKNHPIAKVENFNFLILSFVNPKCLYQSKSCNWSGSGLEFSSDFGVFDMPLSYYIILIQRL